MVERKLDSPMLMMAQASVDKGCSAKNLDNCIGKSGNKASHGCLISTMSFPRRKLKGVMFKRSSKNS
jgi:hypothetical protein